MRFQTILILSILFFNVAIPVWGKETKARLLIHKKLDDRMTLTMKGRLCGTYFIFEKDKDVFATSELKDRFCPGKYSLTLEGPPGTTVTIYGQNFYGKSKGYFTLTKTDKFKVKISDFKSFPDQRWMVTFSNRENGGYESFFQASPGFNKNIGSIKWNEIP